MIEPAAFCSSASSAPNIPGISPSFPWKLHKSHCPVGAGAEGWLNLGFSNLTAAAD